ncbi:MAG: cation diffusion facilitator family transporter [Acidimicrobiales bacterium]
MSPSSHGGRFPRIEHLERRRTMERSRRLTISLGLTLALVVTQVVFSLLAHSTGLMADAGHNLADVGALGLSLAAVQLVRRPPSPSRSYGNHRATILAALANASVIAVVTLFIVIESVNRFGHPEAVRAGIVVFVAAGGFVVNGVATLILRDGTADLNMRSVMIHMAADALASLAVLVGGVVLLAVPTARWIDPASALVVATIIVVQAVSVFRGSVSVLLESTPSDLDVERLSAAMVAVDGVSEVHDLHVWSLSSEVRVLSAHLVLGGHPSLEDAQSIGGQVKSAIAVPFAIRHSTLELECERCVDDVDPCRMEAGALPVAPTQSLAPTQTAPTRRGPE